MRHPVLDHGLTGVLAVAVASPCTTPFMGAALGAALALPTAQALAVFAALGTGMAAPYLAPRSGRARPAACRGPAPWMVRFRTAMAFPMFATVVWLVWVLGPAGGHRRGGGAARPAARDRLSLWLVAVAGPAAARAAPVAAAATVIVASAAAWSWSDAARRAGADARPRPARCARPAPGRPWSTAALAQARADGRPVFVDFTAAWCVTCQINKRATLSDAEVLQAFRANDVLLLRADWTRRRLPRSPKPCAASAAAACRSMRSTRPARPAPQLLSEILTASEVAAALSGRAAKDRTHRTRDSVAPPLTS
jgi:thiol:disulfide interchange protein DsbD